MNSPSFFIPLDYTNWLNLSVLAIAFLFTWLFLHHIYIKSFGLSLKSISLKDIEITPESAEEESILNRHLDEIIYFFQSTKYDLVVIEDLDRFNNPDIFVTLREINSLVNQNAGVKRQIRFLYALRDNMFVNTDRTKFFEFIVPVIPIINSSNSIDKVIEQGNRLSLNDLDRQFLREVSQYLNDLRLIQNLFNEYTIYVKNLESDNENTLNSNKLLAVLIYKNVFPSDFEDLHQGKGKLAEILNKHDALIVHTEARLKVQISEIERKIYDAEKQIPSDLGELRKIYATAFVSKIPSGFAYIDFNGRQNTSVHSLSEHEQFEELFELQEVWCSDSRNQRRRVQIGDFQSEVNPQRTYQDRKAQIEYKLDDFKDHATKTIRQLRAEISRVRFSKFNEIIRRDTKGTTELFEAFGQNSDLVRFLVFEGFLDDTYYQYTSLFHSGRLSPNDNKFLRLIRAFNNPEPDFQIDNPKEVIVAMRDTDFQQNFILNGILIDCMLDEPIEYEEQISNLTGFISSHFDECEEFFSSYYETGKHVTTLTSILADKWTGYLSTILSSSKNIAHVAQLITHLPDSELKTLCERDGNLPTFVSQNLTEILALETGIGPERMNLLPLEVQDLASIKHHNAITRVLADEGLYEVSIHNVSFIFREILGLPYAEELRTKHYTTVLRSENSVLITKIEANFDHYLKNVLLELEHNNQEDVSSIIIAMNHKNVDSGSLNDFIGNQIAQLPSLENVPIPLHPTLFQLKKILPTWDNCLSFINSKTYNPQMLTTFLQEPDIQSALSEDIISHEKSAFPLREFLLNNAKFDEGDYRLFIKMLPKQFRQFPDNFDDEKLLILIEEQKITFSESAFSYLSGREEHQVLFVANNIESYFEIKDQFSLDDEFREKLLRSDIVDNQRLKVIADMDVSLITSIPARASLLADVIHRTDVDVTHWPTESVQALIIHADPTTKQVSLFNKCQKLLTDDQIKQTLSLMPKPFSEIEPGWAQPKLPDTKMNVEFLEWMDSRNIISSWSNSIWGGLRVNNFRR